MERSCDDVRWIVSEGPRRGRNFSVSLHCVISRFRLSGKPSDRLVGTRLGGFEAIERPPIGLSTIKGDTISNSRFCKTRLKQHLTPSENLARTRSFLVFPLLSQPATRSHDFHDNANPTNKQHDRTQSVFPRVPRPACRCQCSEPSGRSLIGRRQPLPPALRPSVRPSTVDPVPFSSTRLTRWQPRWSMSARAGSIC